MKPPPVTQQPPCEGGTHASASPSATQAPQEEAWVPVAQVGVVDSQDLLPFESFVHVQPVLPRPPGHVPPWVAPPLPVPSEVPEDEASLDFPPVLPWLRPGALLELPWFEEAPELSLPALPPLFE